MAYLDFGYLSDKVKHTAEFPLIKITVLKNASTQFCLGLENRLGTTNWIAQAKIITFGKK